ncbi:MAG: winged helix-turn-helix domain-containing protein [Rhodocyclaceae bacterium]|nr:winged helix-turn-helix domain-containing protein [Rhodocyclaceae bacterium]
MRYLFDEFSLDADRFELTRDGEPLRVEPQVIELLLLLIENAGRMVSKDEIIDVVWRGRVVSEAAVSSRIKSARQALGDDGQAQRYIRTVHKKGFRFAGEVRRDQADGDIRTDAEAADPAPLPAEPAPGAPSAGRPAVAVLPFVNLSSDAEQEYLSDGITSDVIARLCKHRWIDVVARNTSFGFKGRAVDVREVGRILSVAYLVEGSVQRAGNRIRVAVQLVDAASGHSRWTERYDREMSDIFALQDEITEMIAARLEPEIGLSERSKLIHSRPPDLHAWDCFHLGIFHFFKFTGADNTEAQRLLRRAQELDPQFGEAFAWWAYALILGMVYWETPPTRELLDEALAACDRALEIDRQNATFHALRARVLLARREYRHAIAENQAAIELNPSFAAAHCGLGDSLAYEKRYDEAVECFDRAIALSPNDPQLWAFYSYGALALIFKGDYDTAVAWTDRAAGIPNCQYWAWAHRSVAMALAGHLAAAARAREHLLQQMPGFTIEFARQKLFYLREAEHIDRYLEGLRLAGVPAG